VKSPVIIFTAGVLYTTTAYRFLLVAVVIVL